MMTFYNEPFIFLVKFRTSVLFLSSFIVIFLGMVFLLLIPCEFPEFLESVFLHLLSILEKFSNIFSPNIASISFPFSSLSEPQLYKQYPYLLRSMFYVFFLHMIIFTFILHLDYILFFILRQNLENNLVSMCLPFFSPHDPTILA